ncbi:single-stranded DNA-binding protein [Merismopedia glauca]|uniref:Single-stranded DNA-binding protein n=1 Tax=Merismopedia glauca CCAP 1448/3 TaxID=1296344 RepID=A0A2T1C836_9CYAN|nr:single-stranded DNA-binding protein [Merismopedia glauca]PSB04442.1 single-stranded DNA-binding protein [Merismopedia glauca CCAP 1448/3]
MNSCILMAEIIVAPERRYTQGDQVLTEMRVQFPGLRAEEPPMTLKVVGWGNVAEEIYEKYHPGDRIIIEGRLRMNTIDRPEGFKEKRAELVASKIYPIEVSQNPGVAAPPLSSTSNYTPPPNQIPVTASSQVTPIAKPLADFDEDARSPEPAKEAAPSFSSTPSYPATERDLDDIPF